MKREQLKEHLVEYLYDELPAELRLEVESALESYPECAAELEELRLVHELAVSAPRLEVSPKIHNDILREARLHASKVTAKRERQRFSLRAFFMSPAFASAMVLGLVLTIGLVLSRQGAGPSIEPTEHGQIAALDEAGQPPSEATAAEQPIEVATGEGTIDEVTLDGELVAEGPGPAPIETNAAFAPIDPTEFMDNFSRAAIDRELEQQAPAGQEPETELTVRPQNGRTRAMDADRSASEPDRDEDGNRAARLRGGGDDSEDSPEATESSRDLARRQRRENDRADRLDTAQRERPREEELDDGLLTDLDDSRNEEDQYFRYEAEGRATAEVPDEAPLPEPDDGATAADTEVTAQRETFLPPPSDTTTLEGDEEIAAGLEEADEREDMVAQMEPRAYVADESSGSRSSGMMDEDSEDSYSETDQAETLNRAWDIPSEQAFSDRGRAENEAAEEDDYADYDALGAGASSTDSPPVAPTTTVPRGSAEEESVASADPDPLSALYEQGLSRYNDGSYRDAIYDFDAFIQNAPSTSNYFSLALYHRALAHMRLGDYGSAIQNLERVISLDQSFEHLEDARFRLARAYELNGDFDRAEELYRSLAGDSGDYEDSSNEGIDRLRERRRSIYRDEVEAAEPADAMSDDFPAMDSAEKPAVSYKRN